MKTKIILILLVFMLFINVVNAEQVFKSYDNIDLKIPCINNETYCSPASMCNITVNAPNGSNIINNQLMTNHIAYHNYTISSAYTNQIGNYDVSMICIDGALFGYNNMQFEITSTGAKLTTGHSIAMVIFTILFVITMILFIFTLFNILGRFLTQDANFLDICYSFSTYFIFLTVNYLNNLYLGNYLIGDMTNLFIYVGAFTNIILPIVAVFLSMIKKQMDIRRMKREE